MACWSHTQPAQHTFLVVIRGLGFLVAPHALQLSLVRIRKHPTMIRPAEVTGPTKSDHKHAISWFLQSDIIRDVIWVHHFAWPPSIANNMHGMHMMTYCSTVQTFMK